MISQETQWDRLSTTDQKGNRVYLYPTDVRGRWKTLRSWLSVVLVILFLSLPWLKINGYSAILLDIPNRKFILFGLTFWAHDTPLLFFVVCGAIISIAFVTAIWGRVWCGWACPQTVFVEHVFRRIERWIEGDSLAQKKLDQAPFNFEKFFKKFSKWSLFTILSAILSHSFMAYFIGTHALSQMMSNSPLEHPSAFLVMLGVTSCILFDFGWFREQFCTVVCPYGRFQSVLMDDQSTVVTYDQQRGEPRRGSTPISSALGDCVNCYRCVQVCPTGIDIRRGVQLECIACTACIDACDDVMKRLKKPLGLIRYGNQTTSASIPWMKRSRAWIYLGLLIACVSGLAFTVAHRTPIELTWIRAIGESYQEIPTTQGQMQVLNHFKVDVRNQTFEEQEIDFSIHPHFHQQGLQLVVSNHKPKLKPGEPERADLFIEFPKNILNQGKGTLTIQVTAKSQQKPLQVIHFNQEVHLVGPIH